MAATTKNLEDRNIVEKALDRGRYEMNKVRERSRGLRSRLQRPRPYPYILEDVYGIRFIYYPWDTVPIKQSISRSFYDDEFGAIRKLVKKDDVIIDLGANVGIHAAFMSKLVGEKGKVFSFEPVPATFDQLQETMVLNRIKNTQTYMQAAGDTEKLIPMSIFPEQFSAWNTFGKPEFEGVEPVGTIKVPTVTMDRFCGRAKITHINFLKIDVEGFELQALRGSKDLLEKGAVDYISFEISQVPLKGAGASATDVFKILEKYGYKSYRYDKKADKFTGPYSDSAEFYENYYASQRDLTKLK